MSDTEKEFGYSSIRSFGYSGAVQVCFKYAG
jgi:hypothetical protein